MKEEGSATKQQQFGLLKGSSHSSSTQFLWIFHLLPTSGHLQKILVLKTATTQAKSPDEKWLFTKNIGTLKGLTHNELYETYLY